MESLTERLSGEEQEEKELSGVSSINIDSRGRFYLPEEYVSFFTMGKRDGEIYFIHNEHAYQGGFKFSDSFPETSFNENPERLNKDFSKLDTVWGFLPQDIPLRDHPFSPTFPYCKVNDVDIMGDGRIVLPEKIRKGTKFDEKHLFLVGMGRKFNLMTEEAYNQYMALLKLIRVYS